MRENDDTSFMLIFPEPFTVQNLDGWQEFFGFDRNSVQVGIAADFDPDTCLLELKITSSFHDNSDIKSNIVSDHVIADVFAAGAIESFGQTYTIKQKYPLV